MKTSMGNSGVLLLRSVEIDVALGRGEIGILFRLAQQFVEFGVEDLAAGFLGFELLAENLFAAAGFALQLGYRSGEVLDGRRLLGNLVGDDRTGFRINLESRLAARTLDLEQAFRHATIVAQ